MGGHPPPSLTWYHDGRKVTADYATELDQDGGLSFPSVETKHAGESIGYTQGLVVYDKIDHSWGCVQLSLLLKYSVLTIAVKF